ncbi:Dabb family protein [uncultured Draconibacterium sp.]|uniref:Dabb family protein n=1 Tax=uncultured Draconibacterium sp. TaxID=1573823 RepID=UPI00326034C2
MATGLTLASLFPLTKKADAGEVKLQGALVHHVFFWLKEPENEQHKQQLLEGLNQLIKVKTIKLSHIGFPASTEDRDVVDHSYSVSYMAMFDNQADQDAYQLDPIHLKFVEQNQHLWNKVIVYDSMD